MTQREIDHIAESDKKDEQTAEIAQNVQNGDLIQRKAAIDALAKFVPYAICDESTESYANGLTDAYNLILQLPSAQPETAKRIVRKSRGGMTFWYQCDMCNEPVNLEDLFCCGCGRRLTDG